MTRKQEFYRAVQAVDICLQNLGARPDIVWTPEKKSAVDVLMSGLEYFDLEVTVTPRAKKNRKYSGGLA